MDILIVSQYLRDIENFNENNSRFVYVAKLLSEEETNVIEIVTSDFNHAKKKHFKYTDTLSNIRITMLHERGYYKNICLSRFVSHRELAKNIKKYLKTRVKPNVCYCAVPSLEVAYVVACYCNQNNVRFIIDVQDLWPEAFKMIFNVPIVSDIIFYPMKKKVDKIYKYADKIIAVSNTYRDRGLSVNKKDTEGLTVYLGTDLNVLDNKLKNQKITYKKSINELWIGYLGTIGSSYDIKTALKAVLQVQKEFNNVKFILLGDGPLLEKYKKISLNLNINAVFLGRREYIDAMKILSQCDVVLNPLVKNASQSIINKVGDYAALGLPVINSLQNKEYKELVNVYKAGINIECENSSAMAQAICFLIENKNERIEMGKGNRQLAEDKFDRKKTYMEIVKTITKERQ